MSVSPDVEYDHEMGRLSHQDYLAQCLARDEPKLQALDQIQGGLSALVRSMIESAFWKMEMLDREELFWRQSNMQPSYSRLQEFLDYQVGHGRDTERNLWLRVLLRVVNGQWLMTREDWPRLRASSLFSPTILARSAYLSFSANGFDTSSSVARLAIEMNLADAMRKYLNASTGLSAEFDNWAARLLARLQSI